MELMTISAFDDWMAEVRSALESINMSIEDWQGIWPFDFQSEHAKGIAPAGAAEKLLASAWSRRCLPSCCQELGATPFNA